MTTGTKLMTMRTRLIVVFTLLCIAAALLLPAVPQSLEYHHFADRRDLLGIANFLDVISNLGFLIVGIAGYPTALRCQIQTVLIKAAVFQNIRVVHIRLDFQHLAQIVHLH